MYHSDQNYEAEQNHKPEDKATKLYVDEEEKERKWGGATDHLLCYPSALCAWPESAVDEAVEDDEAEQR